MTYIIHKTELRDVAHLPRVERSAAHAFTSLPNLSWLADESVMSTKEHERFLVEGLSWVALGSTSRTIYGFIHAEVIEDEIYIAEVSVSETHQKLGIGSQLIKTAMEQAKSMGLSAATLTTFRNVPWNAPYYQRLGFKTLMTETLPLYLKQKLRDEHAAGLRREQRCAMRKAL